METEERKREEREGDRDEERKKEEKVTEKQRKRETIELEKYESHLLIW